MSLRGKLAKLLNKREVYIPESLMDRLVSKYNVHSWFSYIVKDRKNRWDLWKSSFWLADKLNSSSHILETGCGTGTNLLWFWQNGFRNLDGLDLDNNLLSIGEELCSILNARINLWQDDGLNPQKVLNVYDAIISLNWTHLVENYDISKFLKTYSKHLNLNGYHVIDVIDSSYDNYPDNQYLTSDKTKPSEYKKRYSFEQVSNAARTNGYEIRAVLSSKEDVIPKRVYIFQKSKEI